MIRDQGSTIEHEEELEREAKKLRERIEALDRASTVPYPEKIRQDAVAFIDGARSGIDTWVRKRLVEQLDVNHTTLRQRYDKYEGLRQAQGPEQMVRVRVEADAGPGSSGGHTQGLVLELGEVRLTGLSFEEAVEAVRRSWRRSMRAGSKSSDRERNRFLRRCSGGWIGPGSCRAHGSGRRAATCKTGGRN